MSGDTESKDFQVVVVSNRLPYETTATSNHGQKDEQTSKTLRKSVSGLVTALEGLSTKSLWMGGINKDDVEVFQRLLKDKIQKTSTHQKLQPVPIPSTIQDSHKKWSDCKLWPILHGMPKKMDKIDYWKEYKEVNELYADAIVRQLSKLNTAIVWIHDYHLFLVPKMVSEKARKLQVRCSIGFFLHTPFPAVETLEKLPYFKEVLEGMLGSDCIGFHTQDYRRHFLESCRKHMDGTIVDSDKLQFQGREILVQAVPVGIDETFWKQSKSQLSEVFERLPDDLVHELKSEPEKKVLLIGVDRIDYTKGLPQKVEAFASESLQTQLMSDQNHRKFVFLQIAVPCRITVDEYKKLGEEFKKCVQGAKEFLKDNEYPSVIYVIEKLSQQDLSVLYERADVALVTPLIDGLNLVAMEYIACQSPDQPGVLVLSKNAGVAKYLDDDDALQVDPEKKSLQRGENDDDDDDPDNEQEMSKAIYRAVSMPLEERRRRIRKLQKKLKEELTNERWIQLSLKPLRERLESRAKL